MASGLVERPQSPEAPQPALRLPLPRVPEGQRLYVIGDIHGRAELLDKVMTGIAREEARRPKAQVTEIYLGDMINRGPDSRGVLARLAKPVTDRQRIVLRGNHEIAMLRFLHKPDHFPQWVKMGGLDTLASYGIDVRSPDGAVVFSSVRERLLSVMPPAHLKLIANAPLHFSCGDYLFVHAGVRPGIPLDQQELHDLVSIREPFLSWEGELPWHVVHGHTPSESVEIRNHRTGIDTGAYFSDRLTCLVLEGEKRESFATKRRERLIDPGAV